MTTKLEIKDVNFKNKILSLCKPVESLTGIDVTDLTQLSKYLIISESSNNLIYFDNNLVTIKYIASEYYVPISDLVEIYKDITPEAIKSYKMKYNKPVHLRIVEDTEVEDQDNQVKPIKYHFISANNSYKPCIDAKSLNGNVITMVETEDITKSVHKVHSHFDSSAKWLRLRYLVQFLSITSPLFQHNIEVSMFEKLLTENNEYYPTNTIRPKVNKKTEVIESNESVKPVKPEQPKFLVYRTSLYYVPELISEDGSVAKLHKTYLTASKLDKHINQESITKFLTLANSKNYNSADIEHLKDFTDKPTVLVRASKDDCNEYWTYKGTKTSDKVFKFKIVELPSHVTAKSLINYLKINSLKDITEEQVDNLSKTDLNQAIPKIVKDVKTKKPACLEAKGETSKDKKTSKRTIKPSSLEPVSKKPIEKVEEPIKEEPIKEEVDDEAATIDLDDMDLNDI